jgi:hypothetical protein
VQAGRDFLVTEPMKQYEDRKAADAKAKAEADAAKAAGKPAPETPRAAAAAPAPNAPPANGMMAGVVPGAGDPKDNEKKLPVTTFGRYIKVLLSSNEFLFVS